MSDKTSSSPEVQILGIVEVKVEEEGKVEEEEEEKVEEDLLKGF